MKILLVGFAKIKYMPYLHYYLDHIPKGNELHLVYWNRDMQPEDLDAYDGIILHEFARYQEDNVPWISKLGGFTAFRRFVRGILKRCAYDLIICMHTFPCVLLADELHKRYRGRYIFDYRDSTYESFPPFKALIGRLVRGSYATFVSSNGFRTLLPEDCADKIFTSHNLLLDAMNHRDRNRKLQGSGERVRIGFWGYIREEPLNAHLIRKVAVDPRFELHYYGKEQQIAKKLKLFAQQIGAENVYFHGEYKPEDRYVFARNKDILHNLYCDNNMMMAVSNKYYDGLMLYLPQICAKDSVMGDAVAANGVGIVCEPYAEELLDIVWQYYNTLEWNRFVDNCDAALEAVLDEYQMGRTTIEHALEN